MKILCLDTSTPKIVASALNGDTIVHSSRIGKEKHAVSLAPFVQKVIEAAKLELKDLEFIGLGIGPGNLTGLRIGISWAVGVASVVGAKIVPLNSLELISMNAAGRRVVVRKARKGYVYAQVFPDWERPEVFEAESFKRTLANLEEYILLGDGADLFDGDRTIEELWYPLPEILLKLTLERLESAIDYTEVKPLYVQKSIAEINYERRARGGV